MCPGCCYYTLKVIMLRGLSLPRGGKINFTSAVELYAASLGQLYDDVASLKSSPYSCSASIHTRLVVSLDCRYGEHG